MAEPMNETEWDAWLKGEGEAARRALADKYAGAPQPSPEPDAYVNAVSEIERLERQLEQEQTWNLFAVVHILFLTGILIGLLLGLEARVWRGWRHV